MPTRRAVLAAPLWLLAPMTALGQTRADASIDVVTRLLQDAHRALTAGDDRAALYIAIGDAFDFATWERFLLGTRVDRFGMNQIMAFRALLPGYLAHLYREQFDRGLDQAPTLGGTRKARRDILVSTVFPRTSGRNLPVEWRLREVEGLGPRIIDVMIGGTSFLLLKRDEFAATIERGGPDAILNHMRDNAG